MQDLFEGHDMSQKQSTGRACLTDSTCLNGTNCLVVSNIYMFSLRNELQIILSIAIYYPCLTLKYSAP